MDIKMVGTIIKRIKVKWYKSEYLQSDVFQNTRLMKYCNVVMLQRKNRDKSFPTNRCIMDKTCR